MSAGAGIGLDQIEVGHQFRTARRTMTEADIISFSAITGDYTALHSDQLFVERETDFRTRIAQGWLIVAVQSGLDCEIVDWRILAFLSTERRFVAPVYPGDTIHAEYRVEEVRPSKSKPDRGIVSLACMIVNQDGVEVVKGSEVFMVERDAPE